MPVVVSLLISLCRSSETRRVLSRDHTLRSAAGCLTWRLSAEKFHVEQLSGCLNEWELGRRHPLFHSWDRYKPCSYFPLHYHHQRPPHLAIMSWIMHPEGDGKGRIRQRPPKLSNLPKDAAAGPVPATPTKTPRTPGSATSVPGSPWPEFPMKDHYPKVPDPVVEEREVSTKQANRPFLA